MLSPKVHFSVSTTQRMDIIPLFMGCSGTWHLVKGGEGDMAFVPKRDEPMPRTATTSPVEKVSP